MMYPRVLLILVLQVFASQALNVKDTKSVALCTIGSNLQGKLENGLQSCGFCRNGYDRETDKGDYTSNDKRGWGSYGGGYSYGYNGYGGGYWGWGRRCKSYSRVLAEAKREAEKTTCLADSLGWLDNDGNVNETAVSNDLSSLLPSLSSGLNITRVESCADRRLAYKESKLRKCRRPRYTDTEIETLLELFEVEYMTDCLLKAFYKSCFNFVETGLESIAEFLQALTTQTPEELVTLLTNELAQVTGFPAATIQQLLNTLLATLTPPSSG